MELKYISDIKCEKCHRSTDVVNMDKINDNTIMIDLKCRNCGYTLKKLMLILIRLI
jgi:predicted nucleic acid-binding Zn ribbon protein